MYTNYVILPAFNLVVFLYYTIHPGYNLTVFPLESWIIFFSIVCFTRLLEYAFSLRKLVMDDAREYL